MILLFWWWYWLSYTISHLYEIWQKNRISKSIRRKSKLVFAFCNSKITIIEQNALCSLQSNPLCVTNIYLYLGFNELDQLLFLWNNFSILCSCYNCWKYDNRKVALCSLSQNCPNLCFPVFSLYHWRSISRSTNKIL